jgi:hypothetical protein
VEEVRARVVPALEAVAGTLTHLYLGKFDGRGWVDEEVEVEVGYELGVAMGKLRRLKDLALGLFGDGRAFHALAQGLAASGAGDRPLPLLWRVQVVRSVEANPDLLVSLVLPSVGVLSTTRFNGRPACLIACALRLRGYRGIWAALSHASNPSPGAVLQAIAQCSLVGKGIG